MRVEITAESTLQENDLLRVVMIQEQYLDIRDMKVKRSAVLRLIPPEFVNKELAEIAAIRAGGKG